MYCENCGAEISNKSLFCKHCGAKVDPNDNNDIVLVQNNSNEYVAKSIKKNKKRLWRPFGFRSGKWYKAAVACIYFFFLFIMYFGLGLGLSESETPVADILMLVSFTLPYLIMSNLFGLQDKLPLYKSKNPIHKMIACVLTFFIIAFIATLFMPEPVEPTESDIAEIEELEQLIEEEQAQEYQQEQEQNSQGDDTDDTDDETQSAIPEQKIDRIEDLHLLNN